jgi:hypothetical protein
MFEEQQQPQQKKINVGRKQIAFMLDNIHTEIIIQGFVDKIFIMITQLNKPGFNNFVKFNLKRNNNVS